jgi:dGTPase
MTTLTTLPDSRFASYACQASQTRGRRQKEREDSDRSPFRRDCDRIIHSTAFRRLEYKTQVFVNHEGDHYRTRLTHSLEVAQIARSIARLLHLDEDLTEALALAHDLGHPPFGHAGEAGLNEAMEPFGGFDHNAQTLLIVTELEQRYIDFNGLNLTWETLEGIVKHNGPLQGKHRDKTRYGRKLPDIIRIYNMEHDLALDGFPSAEAQVASIADDIAYNNHDLDDGLRAKLLTLSDISTLPYVGTIFSDLHSQYPGITQNKLIHEANRRMIHAMIQDVVETTRQRIKEHRIETADDIRNLGQPLVTFSGLMGECNQRLKLFLTERMYRHYKIARMTNKAARLVRELFTHFYHYPDCLPLEWQPDPDDAPLVRANIIANFIAGMTDRFAMEEHARLFDIGERM